VNFAFVVVVIAAISGIASEVALRAVAPESASALALCVMAVALLGSAWRLGRKPAEQRNEAAVPKTAGAGANQSLAPV
jgi:hypothetical protein